MIFFSWKKCSKIPGEYQQNLACPPLARRLDKGRQGRYIDRRHGGATYDFSQTYTFHSFDPDFIVHRAGALAAQELSLAKQVIERDLPNGLKVLIVQRPEIPTVRCILAYRVGSVNERPGITGISHFHEHMMFKGTYTMGIKPGTLEKDTEYNRQIDALEAQIVAEEAKIKGRDEAKIMALKKQVSDIIAKEKAETIVSEEIWGAYQEAGGTGLNASTGKEMTQYYVTLPKNKLELYLALEADRMANPIFREFYSERDVIVEERRMSENQPGFFFNEQLNATFYAASPYSWEVLGWMSDVSRVTKQEMIDYRSQYYRPDNAVLVLAGDIDVEPTMALVNKYFGPIPAKGPSPRVRTEEPSPEYYRKVNGAGFQGAVHREARPSAGRRRIRASRSCSIFRRCGTTTWRRCPCWARS